LEDDVKKKSHLLQDRERELDTAECKAQLDTNSVATATHEAELLLLREQVAKAQLSSEQQRKLFNQVSEELAESKGQYDQLNCDLQGVRSELQDAHDRNHSLQAQLDDQKAQTLSVRDELDHFKAQSEANLNDADDHLSRIAIAHQREDEDVRLAMCKSLEDRCEGEGEAKSVSELRLWLYETTRSPHITR